MASPASAQKAAKRDTTEADESKSVDDLMKESGDAPAKKKGKKGKAEEPAEEAEEKAPAEEEEIPEPDEWEKPPAEEEKAPPPPPAARVEEKRGDGNQLELGLLLGWGFNTDKDLGALNGYGLGFGIRAGYEFDFKLYVGVGYEYFLGSSDQLQKVYGSTSFGTGDASLSYMLAHAEVGYDIWITDVIVRPSVWLGMAFGTQDPSPLTTGRKTYGDFFFAPGCSVIYVMDGAFIGGDLRLQNVTGDGSSSVAIYVTAGLRF